MSNLLLKLTFEFALQADLESLVDVCLFSALTPEECETDEQKLALIYGQIIVHTMRGETVELKRMLAALPDILAGHAELREVDLACALRSMILSGEFDTAILDQVRRLLMLNESSMTARRWRGELALLLGQLMFAGGEIQKSRDLYQISQTAFNEMLFSKKTLQAQTLGLVCESRLNPSVNLLTRFHDLYRRSIKGPQRDASVATTCLLGISKEYRRAGASLAALKHCNRAVALFERQMGTVGYFEALNYRAELLTSLGRMAEARIDLEMASLSPFEKPAPAVAAVQAGAPGPLALPVGSASEILTAGFLSVASMVTRKPEMVSASTEPVKAQPKGPKLSALEEKLLSILSRGPRERAELADEIYGIRLDSETKRNRFKSLIGTFRKKCPDLVIFDQGRYRIADQVYITRSPQVS